VPGRVVNRDAPPFRQNEHVKGEPDQNMRGFKKLVMGFTHRCCAVYGIVEPATKDTVKRTMAIITFPKNKNGPYLI
jgi:hypothetical protein